MRSASENYLRFMPKVELHCHLEGSVPATTAIALARRNATSLPSTDPDELYRFSDLEGFLELYRAVSRAMLTGDDFAEVTYSSLTDAAQSSNLRYREIAFNPTNHPELSLREMLAGIADGLESARRDRGVRAKIIVAINREHSAETALELVRAVADAGCEHVVGIGLDHNERLGPPQRFADAFALAKAAGLGRTAHAGERGDTVEVADSITLLQLQRVDHGYAVAGDARLIRHSIEHGLHFAACWSTSTFHAGPGNQLPIEAMIAAGLDVSISSDDPPFFATDIGTEYVRAGARLGWTPDEARRHVLAAASAAFLQDRESEDLIATLQAELHAFEAAAVTAQDQAVAGGTLITISASAGSAPSRRHR